MSAILLGCWAVKDTIALRNAMLFLGAPIAALYCYQVFKTWHDQGIAISFCYFIPIILIGLMFGWIIFHFLFLARFPELQFQELRSTWLRAFMGVVLGLATGIALTKRPAAVNILWLGFIPSFLYLYYQYAQKAAIAQSLFAPDYHGYIFYGKISGVLVGTIFIAGVLGTLLDLFPRLGARAKWAMIIFWLFATGIALFSYVFIFDALNGVGLSFLIFGAVGVGLLIRLVHSFFAKPEIKKVVIHFVFLVSLVGAAGWFGWHQAKLNPGWATLIEDMNIAVQVHEYPNWQDPATLGFPKNALGKQVRVNTYERVSWAVVGMTILAPQTPLGVGILSRPFGMLLNETFPNSSKGIISSHSAWVELTLAFGFPALVLTLGAIGSILVLALHSSGPFRYLVLLLGFSILCLYTVGEVSSQHGIEILYFMIALMAGLLIPQRPTYSALKSVDQY
ncbi:hypothetical protein [Polynucleobacter sp. HIN5]|uniref:hypothetical protein n=1 Tax=Polynucleobacter sp. HIN5 TaxID=3047864 RepID=UPI002573A989|nr:hypothetical protein [Polynucleobacter sp. HIN5]BEI32929.1 hypothetical protein PHIN5_02970 [Polynucleobacter sp. HIN5]